MTAERYIYSILMQEKGEIVQFLGMCIARSKEEAIGIATKREKGYILGTLVIPLQKMENLLHNIAAVRETTEAQENSLSDS